MSRAAGPVGFHELTGGWRSSERGVLLVAGCDGSQWADEEDRRAAYCCAAGVPKAECQLMLRCRRLDRGLFFGTYSGGTIPRTTKSVYILNTCLYLCRAP